MSFMDVMYGPLGQVNNQFQQNLAANQAGMNYNIQLQNQQQAISQQNQQALNNTFNNFGQQTDYYSALSAAYGRQTGYYGDTGASVFDTGAAPYNSYNFDPSNPTQPTPTPNQISYLNATQGLQSADARIYGYVPEGFQGVDARIPSYMKADYSGTGTWANPSYVPPEPAYNYGSMYTGQPDPATASQLDAWNTSAGLQSLDGRIPGYVPAGYQGIDARLPNYFAPDYSGTGTMADPSFVPTPSTFPYQEGGTTTVAKNDDPFSGYNTQASIGQDQYDAWNTGSGFQSLDNRLPGYVPAGHQGIDSRLPNYVPPDYSGTGIMQDVSHVPGTQDYTNPFSPAYTGSSFDQYFGTMGGIDPSQAQYDAWNAGSGFQSLDSRISGYVPEGSQGIDARLPNYVPPDYSGTGTWDNPSYFPSGSGVSNPAVDAINNAIGPQSSSPNIDIQHPENWDPSYYIGSTGYGAPAVPPSLPPEVPRSFWDYWNQRTGTDAQSSDPMAANYVPSGFQSFDARLPFYSEALGSGGGPGSTGWDPIQQQFDAWNAQNNFQSADWRLPNYVEEGRQAIDSRIPYYEAPSNIMDAMAQMPGGVLPEWSNLIPANRGGPAVLDAMNNWSGVTGADPSAGAALFTQESQWNPLEATKGNYGVGQIASADFDTAGGTLNGLTFNQYLKASAADQIGAHADLMSRAIARTGLNLTAYQPPLQYAIMQALNFGPQSSSSTPWVQALRNGDYTVQTGPAQGGNLNDTSINSLMANFARLTTGAGQYQ